MCGTRPHFLYTSSWRGAYVSTATFFFYQRYGSFSCGKLSNALAQNRRLRQPVERQFGHFPTAIYIVVTRNIQKQTTSVSPSVIDLAHNREVARPTALRRTYRICHHTSSLKVISRLHFNFIYYAGANERNL
jgi:hypothetical protein